MQLWDGQQYDADELARTCPALVEYAREHMRLSERVEASHLESLRRRKPVEVRTTLIAFLLLILSVGVISSVCGVEMRVVMAFVVGVAIVSAVLFMAFYSSRFRKDAFPRTISVQDDMVTVESPHGQDSFSLAQCCWYPGRISDDDALAGSLAKGPALILVAPSGVQFACGLDEQMRPVWRMFFQVTGLRRVLSYGWVGGWLLPLFSVAAAFAAGIGAWQLCETSMPVLQRVMGVAVAEKLPAVSATVAAWTALLGCFLVVPGWYRGTDTERAAVLRFSALLPLVVIGTGHRGLGLANWGWVAQLSITPVLAAALCVCAWLALRFIDRRRRIAKGRTVQLVTVEDTGLSE